MTIRLALLVALPRSLVRRTSAGGRCWSLAPVERPELPAVRDEAWCRMPIDRFVLARLEAAQLMPAPEAARASTSS